MSAGPLLAVLEPAARADALRLAAQLEATPGSGCLLGPHGEIVYVNDGWDRFAAENGGAPSALGAQLLGKRYATYVNGAEARSFFEGLWLRVVSGQEVAYRTDCDAADRRREPSTSFTPVRLGTSLGAVVLHKIVEGEISRAAERAGRSARETELAWEGEEQGLTEARRSS